MKDKFEEPEWSKQASLEFAEEYCDMVDRLFIENLKDIHGQINIAQILQGCINTTSKSYGFKVNE